MADELKWVKQYLSIEKLRMDTRLNYQISCHSELLKYKIPILCIQPLVENAVIHGLQPLEKGGTININISKTNSILMIIVQNPFLKTIPKQSHSNSNHMALKNIKERLALQYGNKAYMNIDNNDLKNSIFTITLSIPV